MNLSLRFWLIFSFSLIFSICLLALLLSIYNQNQINKIELRIQQIQDVRITFLETNKLKEDIFIGDLINPQFYELKNPINVRKHNVRVESLKSSLEKLLLNDAELDPSLKNYLSSIIKYIDAYNQNFKTLVSLFKKKGFKDYGLEGQMRNYAHEITNYNDDKIKFYSLLLRKHEKDFLIRKELAYISGFNDVSRQLITYVHSSPKFNTTQKNELYNLLYFYNKYFKFIAQIENKIGFKGKQGLLQQSNSLFENINYKLAKTEQQLISLKNEAKNNYKNQSLFLYSTLFLFLISILYYLTISITRSLKHITQNFKNYTESSFVIAPHEFARSPIFEFNMIYIHFLKMAKEINSYTNHFKEKVHERTLEINKQKEALILQQEQIEKQYLDLKKTNTDLTKQKKLLDQKNKDVTESLKYAKRIQKALLPKSKTYNAFFKDNFILTKAKDIVSGDFNLIFPYKSYEFVNDNYQTHENVLLITADCTGHGVPGAFISVLAINSINKLVKLLNICEPGQLLNSLDSDINNFLSYEKKDKDLILDGMDIAVFTINMNTLQLKYCIAKFSCLLIRNGSFIDLHSQNYSIGYNITAVENKKFSTQTIQLEKGDRIYMYSDGFHDQFGGPLNKKYKRRSLNELIMNMHHLSMKQQKELLKNELADWKRNYDQTDDITVIGFQV